MFWHIILTLLIRVLLADSLFQTDIIKAFFEKYSINHGVLLNCFSKKEQISLLKHFIPNTTVMSSSTNLGKIDLINLLYIRHGRLGIVLDGDCAESKRIITLCGRHRFFDIKYYWLIFATEFDHLFSEADFNIDSNIHTVSSSKSQSFQIYDFYNTASKKGGHIVKTQIGIFTNSTGYRFSDINNKFWQRRNLTGIVFNTTLVLHEPYSGTVEDYLKSNDNREYNTYNRFHARLMIYCMEHYDFRLNTSVTPLFGYQKGDGTMDGLAGDLERRISDFGLSPLFVRADRANVITYGRLTYTIRSAFVFRNPKSKTMFELFLRPLSQNVWYCFLGFCIVTCFIIRAVSYVENVDNGCLNWPHSVLSMIGIISQQGLIITPTTISGRIAMLFALNLTYFVYQFYSGSLVSSLLNIPLVQIETVDDILNANFKVGIQDNRFNREYFKYTVDNASIKLYKSMIMGNENQAYLSVTRGLNKIKAGRYAFHVEMAKAYPFIKKHFKKGICEISEVPMYESPKCYANYAKHSPFRDIMDVCLHRIAESGVMQKENTFWHTKKPECWYNFEINTGLEEVYPVAASMIIGLLISVMILVIEIGRRRISRA